MLHQYCESNTSCSVISNKGISDDELFFSEEDDDPSDTLDCVIFDVEKITQFENSFYNVRLNNYYKILHIKHTLLLLLLCM